MKKSVKMSNKFHTVPKIILIRIKTEPVMDGADATVHVRHLFWAPAVIAQVFMQRFRLFYFYYQYLLHSCRV